MLLDDMQETQERDDETPGRLGSGMRQSLDESRTQQETLSRPLTAQIVESYQSLVRAIDGALRPLAAEAVRQQHSFFSSIAEPFQRARRALGTLSKDLRETFGQLARGALEPFGGRDEEIEASTGAHSADNAPGRIPVEAKASSSRVRQQEILVATDPVNLRVEPHTNSAVVTVIYPNQRMRKFQKKRMWVYVSYFDFVQRVPRSGWVFSKYLRKLPSEAGHSSTAPPLD